MKRFFIIAALILCFCSTAFAGPDFVKHSTKTSSALVTSGSGLYHGIKVNTDGTNAATITIYDNTEESGSTVDPQTVYVTSSTIRVQASGSNPPRRYYNGLYVSISCSGTVSVTVEYVPD